MLHGEIMFYNVANVGNDLPPPSCWHVFLAHFKPTQGNNIHVTSHTPSFREEKQDLGLGTLHGSVSHSRVQNEGAVITANLLIRS